MAMENIFCYLQFHMSTYIHIHERVFICNICQKFQNVKNYRYTVYKSTSMVCTIWCTVCMYIVVHTGTTHTVTVVVVEISKLWFLPLLWVACGCAASDPLCDGTTGQCICPTGVTERSCDRCEDFTFGYDPVNGCTVSCVHVVV